MKILGYFVPLMLLFLFFTGCSSTPPATKETYLMGTVVQVKAYGKNGEKAAAAAIEKIQNIEKLMTINAENSEIISLNDHAGKGKVQVSEESFYVLGKAIQYAKLSNGAFDPTIGPIVKLWAIGTDKARVPSKGEIDTLLPLVAYKRLKLSEEGSKKYATLEKEGQIVDLGGIAKGYAADAVREVFTKYGVTSAFVNLGGNVLAIGNKPDRSAWKIGIQDPFQEKGGYFGIVNITGKTVVTSGNYERYFIKDGVRYHHIINPATGYPADQHLVSTTIIGETSVDADALSTATYVLGLRKAMELVDSLKGIDAIFVTSDRKVYMTQGLKEYFTLTSGDFSYEKWR